MQARSVPLRLSCLLLLSAFAMPSCDQRGNVTETSDATTDNDATDTARNERDRDGGTLTPPDQGESATDLALTQRIRQAVTDAEDMSLNAQNIKIITVGGHVTLRGPVDSQEEHDRIIDIANSIAGASNVDDQLEITG